VARNEILDIMKEAVDNRDLTKVKRVPVIKELKVSPQDRGRFVGVGGMNLKRIEKATG
jgi:polyribonucleotide nucleotidyltransferase